MILKVSYLVKIVISFVTLFFGIQALRFTNMLNRPPRGNDEDASAGCLCTCDKDIFPFGGGPDDVDPSNYIFYSLISIGGLSLLYNLYSLVKN
tara:strand:+ start:330 stop:608 length:279 start_codon:yes stop_codon:yes gene_type:complete